jgi:hypothetical protein
MQRRKPHTEETKRKISETLKKRKLGNHIVKGSGIGAKVGGGYGVLQGALSGGLLAGPGGALAGGVLGGGFGAYSGAVSGSAYGAGTYATRKGLDKLRGRKKYTYDYSLTPSSNNLEFKRGPDKKKRKRRSLLKTGAKIAAVAGVGALGAAGALAVTKKSRMGNYAASTKQATQTMRDAQNQYIKTLTTSSNMRRKADIRKAAKTKLDQTVSTAKKAPSQLLKREQRRAALMGSAVGSGTALTGLGILGASSNNKKDKNKK